MRRRIPRIIAVFAAFMLLAGANPFRVIPDTVADVGAELAQAAERQHFLLQSAPQNIAYNGSIPADAAPSLVSVAQPAIQEEDKAAEPRDDAADADSDDKADSGGSDEHAPEEENEKNPGAPEAERTASPTSAPNRPLVAVNAREMQAEENNPQTVQLEDEKEPSEDEDVPGEESIKAQLSSRVEADAELQSKPHPILGTVQKTWQVKEDGLSIRVDQRKIGKNTVYIGTIRASVDRMGTYTVAGPGKTASSRTTSSMAKGVDATIAINGDCYDYHTRRGYGIVIRNGVLYNNVPYGRWCYIVYEDGSAKVAKDTDLDAQKLLLNGAKDVFAFGPALVRGGRFVKPEKENTHPRTAIGRVSDNVWIFMVVDGRQAGYSTGITYKGLAELFLALGCDSAYNLDGGGSSALWLKGYGVINRPSEGSERRVPDIIYFR